jgi:hypothetical protein
MTASTCLNWGCDMFDILRTADRAVANDAAYRVGLRIREREYFRNWRKWLPLRPDDRLFPCSIAIATRVIEEIERAAGKRLSELTDEELDPFERRINEILRERRAAEHPDTEGVGERILAELRRDYGLPEWRAVA